MSDNQTQRYNLVFSGQLFPGTERARAELILAAFFRLRDVAAVRGFFSGKPVPLRRNLERGEALRLYRQLRSVGLVCDVLKATEDSPPDPPPRSESPRETGPEPQSAPPRVPQRKRSASRPESATVLQIDDGHHMGVRDARSAATAPPPGAARRPARNLSPAPPPNLFALRPGTVPGDPGPAAERLQARALIAGASSAMLCIVVLAIALRFPALAPGVEPRGPLAIASRANGELLVLIDQALLLHARSGLARARLGAAELGVSRFAPPLLALTDGNALVGAYLPDDDAPQLLRCDTAAPSCAPYLTLDPRNMPVAVAESLLGDALFVFDAQGKLARYDSDGSLQEERKLRDAVDRPRLRYHQGLLLIPDSGTPLLGVHRSDREDFGTQLDALFLAATDSPAADQLLDIALAGDDRYALVADDAGQATLLRFDAQWGAGSALTPVTRPQAESYLAVWRNRVLLADPSSAVVQRIAPGAAFEASFTSSLLRDERDEWLRLTRQREWLQGAGLILPLGLALFGAAVALLYFTAARVLRSDPAARTALLDPLPAGIAWTAAAPGRRASLRRVGLLVLALATIPTAALIYREQLFSALCLIPALFGALYAISALHRGSGGHFGRRGDRVVLVDFDGRYFYGRCKSVIHRAGFLFAGQVALPLSPGALSNLQNANVDGIPIDRSPGKALGRLWLLGHPWIAALLAVLGGWLASAALLLLSR
ncbi:MAG: hypothetical protein AAF933_03740 [Pseudomonadota bacterium]